MKTNGLTVEQIERFRYLVDEIEGGHTLCDMALASLTLRDEGIEAAAKLCDNYVDSHSYRPISYKIRALAAQEDQPQEQSADDLLLTSAETLVAHLESSFAQISQWQAVKDLKAAIYLSRKEV